MSEVISPRGSTVCRACGSHNLESVLDLGSQPLPAEYGRTPQETMEEFPLHMRICPQCGLGQLGEYVLPERIFHSTYPYLSSASTTWVEHARNYAAHMRKTLSLGNDTLVLELASNDGYLLSAFKSFGIPVLGVEPADNVASLARAAGIATLTEFFGSRCAANILKQHGHPRLIVANNVFAHIPDMHDFMEGIAALADDDTVITIENPSFVELLQRTLFDTIYHEHYSYLTAHSVGTVARVHGLDIVHVDQLPTHGGSNRYWLSRRRQADKSVADALQTERDAGLFNPAAWRRFASQAMESIEGLRSWLLARRDAGDVVAGYGAAHKGNTFLNAVGEASRILEYVVDASSEKQGRFLPGSRVPVLAPDQLGLANPSDVLILPWNIAEEIASRVRSLTPNARIWVAQPCMRAL